MSYPTATTPPGSAARSEYPAFMKIYEGCRGYIKLHIQTPGGTADTMVGASRLFCIAVSSGEKDQKGVMKYIRMKMFFNGEWVSLRDAAMSRPGQGLTRG